MKDGFIPRLARSLKFSPSVHGENGWTEFINGLDEGERNSYYRLNLPIAGREPELDDARHIQHLPRDVRSFLSGSDSCDEIARALWASSLFFELEDMPTFANGMHHCRGFILCRRPHGQALIDHVLERFPHARLDVNNEQLLGPLSKATGCSGCSRFSKAVSFEVHHLDEQFTMILEYNGRVRNKISGFPHPISWFVEQQGLGNAFSRLEHTPFSRKRHCSCSTLPVPKRRRVRFDCAEMPQHES